MSKAAIFAAARELDLQATKRLLMEKPELLAVVDRKRENQNLLHLACAASPERLGKSQAAQTRYVRFLLEKGLDIDTPVGRDACTPLFFAVARARNRLLVKELISRGASVSAVPGGGLFAAAWWNDVATLKLLIRSGAKIDVVVGITPFLASWCWRKFDAAKALVLSGANADFQDSRGKTALHHGVEKNFDPALLSWLVKHGASADIEDRAGVSARQRASRKRDKRYLKALAP
ncbi:MAG TPA: ankyrin repeat domain-containing protein [Gemmatimonadaceae bacterium]|nr:ankyrin repeat domain-containing protein [Gemmatimonadaceae bacterium]